MTINEFRRMVLEIPGAMERSHMHHPDFRVVGKIFASLGVPDENWGMVKLTPEQQRTFIQKAAKVFKPCRAPGADNVTRMFIFPLGKRALCARLSTLRRGTLAHRRGRNAKGSTSNFQRPMIRQSQTAATAPCEKTRSRRLAETPRDRFHRFEIGE
jgi:hypothetical protein